MLNLLPWCNNDLFLTTKASCVCYWLRHRRIESCHITRYRVNQKSLCTSRK